MINMRVARSAELSESERTALRRLLDDAFRGRFDEDDWHHTLGGLHVLVFERSGAQRVLSLQDDAVVAHAAVVERTLSAGDRPLRTGYVEGVATRTASQRQGLASQVMREADRLIVARYELGALSDGAEIPGFYERFGWESWRGPTLVASPAGPRRTPEDDDTVMVLRTPATADLDLAVPLTCDWRAGDVW